MAAATRNYYQILGVPVDAKPRDITKAYRMLALQHHPDRKPANEKSDMTEINEAYDCLKDPEKRRIYDLTGSSDPADGFLQGGVVAAADISSFCETYQNGPLEEEDVLNFLILKQGDVTELLDYIPLSTSNDLNRLLAIAEKQIKTLPPKCRRRFSKTSKELLAAMSDIKKKERRERKRFERASEDSSFAELVATIQANQKRRRKALI